MNNQPFTVRQAISRAKQPPAQALRDALEAAGVDSARSLGWSLLRLAHEMTGPIEVLRLTERRDGVLWQLRPRVLRVSVEKPA